METQFFKKYVELHTGRSFKEDVPDKRGREVIYKRLFNMLNVDIF
jgi:hypothetical protein